MACMLVKYFILEILDLVNDQREHRTGCAKGRNAKAVPRAPNGSKKIEARQTFLRPACQRNRGPWTSLTEPRGCAGTGGRFRPQLSHVPRRREGQASV